MIENALYYTLSTIAQTLAGALAMLVAVVLFSFNRVGGRRERHKGWHAMSALVYFWRSTYPLPSIH